MTVSNSDIDIINSPITGIDLSTVTAEFAGHTYTAAEASPDSITAAAGVHTTYLSEARHALVMLRASVNRELEALVEPSPIAYCAALLEAGLRVSAQIVYFGDDFTYNGQVIPWTHTPNTSASRGINDIAGVALSLQRYGEDKATTFYFVDRQQLDTANRWFITEACGGMQPVDSTLKAMMLNVAIRYMAKWTVNERFAFKADFTRYFRLVQIHHDNAGKGANEREMSEKNNMVAQHKYRFVRNVPSVTEALMAKANGKGGKTDTPLLKTFEPAAPLVSFDDFEMLSL